MLVGRFSMTTHVLLKGEKRGFRIFETVTSMYDENYTSCVPHEIARRLDENYFRMSGPF